jgi:hypothetical protein
VKVCRRTNKRCFVFLFSDMLAYGYSQVGLSSVFPPQPPASE